MRPTGGPQPLLGIDVIDTGIGLTPQHLERLRRLLPQADPVAATPGDPGGVLLTARNCSCGRCARSDGACVALVRQQSWMVPLGVAGIAGSALLESAQSWLDVVGRGFETRTLVEIAGRAS